MENPAPTKQTKRKAKQGTGCPHCGGRCRTIPGGVTDNPMETAVYLQCQDVTCGAVFRAVMSITQPSEPAQGKPQATTAQCEEPRKPAREAARKLSARERAEADDEAERARARSLLNQRFLPSRKTA